MHILHNLHYHDVQQKLVTGTKLHADVPSALVPPLHWYLHSAVCQIIACKHIFQLHCLLLQ